MLPSSQIEWSPFSQQITCYVMTCPLGDGKLQENWKQLSTAGPPAPGGNREGGRMTTAAGRTAEISCVSILHEDESISVA